MTLLYSQRNSKMKNIYVIDIAVRKLALRMVSELGVKNLYGYEYQSLYSVEVESV